MKRFFFSLALLIGILSLSTFSSASAYVESEPTSTLNKYLQAVKDKNIEEIINNVQDDRYEDDKNLQKDEYMNQLNEQKLTNYEIIDSKVIDENNQQLNAVLTFENGEIVEILFSLEKNGGTWKVHVSLDSLEEEEDDFHIIQEGKEISTISPKAAALVSWSFSGRAGGSVFYSTDSFTIPGTTATLAGNQSHSYVSQGWPVSITYQVVKKHWYGDTVWGGITVKGSGSFSKKITGTGKMTGAKIKFKTANGNTTSMGYKGSGTLNK
ncbi:hypothetical protein [Peribacillus aracenensis]|uniref:hypothetical protein n=1 Tax=Peribacillus aracenensis TaxID=2976708 RepID=UPI0021A8AFA3|nr:hypothetical protein [Peribacillus sp. BBB004]